MASDEQMREQVKKVYRNKKLWTEKVNKMPNAQVAAIYLRLLDQKKI